MASTTLTPEQRKLRARIGALALHAQGRTSTTAGTTAFLLRFEREVDPAGELQPAERARRAEYARRAYFATLALKASITRSKKKGAPDRDSGAPQREDGRTNAATTAT